MLDFDDNRTTDSVVKNLLFEFSNQTSLTGRHDHVTGVRRLVEEQQKNAVFSESLVTVAETLLGLFPVE